MDLDRSHCFHTCLVWFKVFIVCFADLVQFLCGCESNFCGKPSRLFFSSSQTVKAGFSITQKVKCKCITKPKLIFVWTFNLISLLLSLFPACWYKWTFSFFKVYSIPMNNITHITHVFLPSVFNIFVDAASDDHGHNSIIPGRDEHERKTQAHSQEGQSPVGENTHFTTPVYW